MHCAEVWESVIQNNDTLSQEQYSEYLNKCIEYENDYYNAHPLQLSFAYYSIKKPSKITTAGTTKANATVKPKAETTPTFSTAASPNSSPKVQATKCVKCGAHYPADMAACPTCGNQGANAKPNNGVPGKPQSTVVTPQQTTSTQTNGFADLIQKGLGHLQRNLSELKDSEVGEAMLALALKHSTRWYLTIGTESFNNKIEKAKAAYAKVPAEERVLVMADDTIFGSAKEGFVLTDKHIYINISGCKNKCVAIADITSVYSTRGTGLTDIMVSAPSGNYRMSYRSEIADGEACKNFLYELIHYLNPNCSLGNGAPAGNVPTAPVTPAPTQTVATPVSIPNVPKWQCSCGNINSGKFCSKCGSKKEDGTPLWTCSCGSVNKGKFCPKCGSPKKEE